jgi:hypothetical protein
MSGNNPTLPIISISQNTTQTGNSASVSRASLVPDDHRSSPTPQLLPPRRSATHTGYWQPSDEDEILRRSAHKDPRWTPWNEHDFVQGRVLIIDHVSNGSLTTADGTRQLITQVREYDNLKDLQDYYVNQERVKNSALRIVHVQNAKWATPLLVAKYNMDHPKKMVGMQSFEQWAKYEKARVRNGKPAPTGRTWRRQTDPWRNISRTAFGIDYLKTYQTKIPGRRREHNDTCAGANMMHLNAYEDDINPHGYDVAVQRISVYVQTSLGPASLETPPGVLVENPYLKHDSHRDGDGAVEGAHDPLASFDNGNTIIVFQTSASQLLNDCLVKPRNDMENRWRRLSIHLRKEDTANDTIFAARCTNLIITDIFHELREIWDFFLARTSDHIAMLEAKIYDNPADESRAPELWRNQAAWLKVEKIMWYQNDVVREMKELLKELSEECDQELEQNIDWLAGTTAEYERLTHNITEDLVQPTSSLSELMYRSVAIRDSRQSLQIGLSMWRLSWITFIFLPLTFSVSFFGMNVDIFQGFPSIGWYFLTAVVLMILGKLRSSKNMTYRNLLTIGPPVLVLWFTVKHSLQRARQTPYERGLYERLFEELEDQYPNLWSSRGAASNVTPETLTGRWKWVLLKRWFAPERTIDNIQYSTLTAGEDMEPVGHVNKLKRFLLRRWLSQISTARRQDQVNVMEMGLHLPQRINPAPSTADPFASVNGVYPGSSGDAAIDSKVPARLRPTSARAKTTSGHSNETPESRWSNSLMIEERNFSDSEDAGEEGSSNGRSPQLVGITERPTSY